MIGNIGNCSLKSVNEALFLTLKKIQKVQYKRTKRRITMRAWTILD